MAIGGNYEQGLEQSFNPDPVVDEPLEPEEEVGIWDGMVAGWQEDELSLGIDVNEDTRQFIFKDYSDYETNKPSYDAYGDMTRWWKPGVNEDVMRAQIDRTVDEGRWTLDEQGNVVDSDTSWINDSFMYDMDAIKGALLAKANGFNKDVFAQGYKDYTALENKRLNEITDEAPIGSALGMMGSYIASPEGAFEIIGSPGKITGATITKMAMKRFGIESMLAMGGGMSREAKKRSHAYKAELNYGLADSAENILMEMVAAGTLGAIGSIAIDKLTLRQVKKRMNTKWGDIDATDQEILERFFRREDSKLTRSSVKHEDLMMKTELDINEGRPANVSEELDIPIETKLPDESVPNSMPDEVNLDRISKGIDDDVATIQKSIDDTPEAPADTTGLRYGSMADDVDGDELITGIAKVDPEIDAELKALELEEATLEAERNAVVKTEGPGLTDRQQEVKDASVVPIGGSEDETAKAVKDMFKKNTSEEAILKNLSKDDIAELDRQFEEELLQSKPEGISDNDWIESNAIFSKFGDNLAAGTLAGVDVDEEGNITFDPEKFVLGLGGYTAAKAAIKVLAKDGRITKEMMDYAGRRLDEFESTRAGQAVTGRSNIVNDGGKASNVKEIPKPPRTKVSVSENDNFITLSKIEVDKDVRGQGRAKIYMMDLVKYADATGKKIALSPTKEFGAKIGRLKQFYKDLGFKENKGKAKDFETTESFIYEPKEKQVVAKEKSKPSDDVDSDYKMSHSAPEPEGANSGDNVSDIYPDSPSDKNFERYYGTGDKVSDRESIAAMKKMDGNPEADITIYRAAPKSKDINEGDWITLSKNYAQSHGENYLDDFDIISKQVKAKDVFTNGDSLNEWGYYP